MNQKASEKMQVEIVFQLAPQQYIETLYHYENKFMLYDTLSCQILLIEKKKRLNHNYNKEDIKGMLNNYTCPDIIKKSIGNQNLINIINNFNANYEKIMDEYIEFINYIADLTTIKKQKIVPKGIGILGIIAYGNIMYGLNRDEVAKQKMKEQEEIKLEKNMFAEIKQKREEAYNKILSNYEILKKELLEYLDYK